MECVCPEELNSGNLIKYFGGPEWTPYAQAIAEAYSTIVPFYLTVPTTLTGATRERKTFKTDPYQHDVLIFGAHVNIGNVDSGDSGQQVFLQVADLRTGIPWATPNSVNGSPATAFGGSQVQPMPILRLPEAFFLPRFVELQHDWKMINAATVTGGSITWVGVQMINHCPENPQVDCVTMPDGRTIKVGSRLPWFSTLGLGRESWSANSLTFNMNAGSHYLSYTPPQDCDIEIHEINANFFSQAGVSSNPQLIQVKISDAGEREMWTPDLAPSPAVLGSFSQAYPSLPFTKPYILKKGHRLQFLVRNGNPSTAIGNAYATIRGVRLCEY